MQASFKIFFKNYDCKIFLLHIHFFFVKINAKTLVKLNSAKLSKSSMTPVGIWQTAYWISYSCCYEGSHQGHWKKTSFFTRNVLEKSALIQKKMSDNLWSTSLTTTIHSPLMVYRCFVPDSFIFFPESKFPEDPKRKERFINNLEKKIGFIWFRNLMFNTLSRPWLFLASLRQST